MDMIFIAGGFLVALLFFLSQSLVKGVGTVGGALKAIGLFILQKNPPGLVDIFDDRDGSGARTWMNFGMLWLCLLYTSPSPRDLSTSRMPSSA